jgi:hypothetical protein
MDVVDDCRGYLHRYQSCDWDQDANSAFPNELGLSTVQNYQHLFQQLFPDMELLSSGSKKKRARKPPDPTVPLTDDLLVDILTRVSYMSLCRCWLDDATSSIVILSKHS